tara:strand:- start:1060 stop:1251 length:192 start_codon:yes stop_codon:yes gene_type:complete
MFKFLKKLKSFFVKEKVEYETVRARTKKGRFAADDPSTTNVNEAYKKLPKKKTKKKTSKKSKK